MRNRNASNHKYLVFSFVAAFTFIGMFAFYGCQFFQQKNEPVNVDEATQSRRIGILKSLGGVRTSNQGTHLLQLDNGDNILLKSLQMNLDDEKYLGKSVEVYGIMNYTTDKKQIMEVMSIDVVSDISSQEVSVPVWKEYIGASQGFSIKYRDDLILDESNQHQVIFKRNYIGGSISTQETTQILKNINHQMIIRSDNLAANETVIDYLKVQFQGLKSDSPQDLLASGISRSKIGSNSVDAYKVVNTDSGKSVITYYIFLQDNVVIINLESGNDENTLDAQNLFYAMLGTIKFSGTKTASQQVIKPEKDAVNNNVEAISPASVTITQSASANNLSSSEIIKENEVKPDVSSATNFAVGNENIADNIETPDAIVPVVNEIVEPATQESISGFTTMDSVSFKFNMQYPKKWFYNGTASAETGVIRHYDFGTKPLDEQPGITSMDIMTGTIPSGSEQQAGGNTVTKVINGDQVVIYTKGSGSRVYKFSGPAGQESTLLQMAGSIQE